MIRRLVVFATVLIILAFITGCPPVKPEPAESPEDRIVKLEPTKVEPNEVEPDEVTPIEPEPNDIRPTGVEPNEIEPNEPVKVEPNEPRQAEPNEVEPIKVEPNDIEPTKTDPNKVKPLPKVAFHDKCAYILKNFVDDKGMVKYKALRLKRLKLKELLYEFDNLDSKVYNSWPKEDKIAFWINAYNIQMLRIITQNYPIKPSKILSILFGPYSIRHIKGIWTDYKFMVMDEEFTLAAIDQRFFRKQFNDPRVFFAISHASLSSPPLRNEPYYGYKLHEQLEDQTKRFLSSPRAFKVDRDEKTVYLSAVLQSSWHGKEFIGKFGTDKKFKDQQPATRAVLNFLTNYIPKQDVSFLEVGNYSVKYIRYDWTLNDGS